MNAEEVAQRNAQKQKSWKDKQRAKGLVRFEQWVTPLEREYLIWKLGEIRLAQGKGKDHGLDE